MAKSVRYAYFNHLVLKKIFWGLIIMTACVAASLQKLRMYSRYLQLS